MRRVARVECDWWGERLSGVKSEDIGQPLFPSSIPQFSPDNLIATQISNLQQWPNVSPSANASLITPHLRGGALSRLPAVTSAITTSKSSLLHPSVVTAAPSSMGCVSKPSADLALRFLTSDQMR